MPRQDGAVLLIVAGMLALALSATLLARMRGATAAERERHDLRALAQAREALIGFATTVAPDTAAKRPGDLPCPDLDNDGDAEATCIAQAQRLGRLPWKTLGIPDLRDAAGERFWYAVSARFKRNNVNACPMAGGANCLNSESNGTLTVRDSAGAILHDGTTNSGAIALIIAPGSVLTRQGVAAPQSRSCAGDANPALCTATGRCSSVATPLCNPANYLDRVGPPVRTIVGAVMSSEDNADLVEGTATNGFIQGPIRERDDIVVNDRIAIVRYADIVPALERRVAVTAQRCLDDYAASSSNRLPWAASPLANYTIALPDQVGETFGRLPNSLAATALSSGMAMSWPASCPITWSTPQHKWWANWQNLVYFAIAPAYSPSTAAPACGACIAVAPGSPTSDKRFVVLVAGQALAGQSRGVGATASAYLEDLNASGGPIFVAREADLTFNDTVVYE